MGLVAEELCQLWVHVSEWEGPSGVVECSHFDPMSEFRCLRGISARLTCASVKGF